MTPIVSVVMSVYNQAEFLSQALNSILAQSLPQFEVIIIDDDSNQATQNLLRGFSDNRIKLIRHPHRLGLAKSLNTGIKLARGQFVARMDADDIALPHRFKTQFNYLKEHPNIAGCGSAVELINTQGKTIGHKRFPASYSALKKVILRYNPFIHSSMMIRKKILDELGNYDTSLNGAEDYDLWLRLISQYPLVNLNHILLKYRINPHGVSWRSLKHVETQALKARINALINYGYPKWQAIFLAKPALSLLIPTAIKKHLFRIP